jgi:intein/homing endonuclease
MTPIGAEPDPRGIDRNDKQAMADYRRRLADFKRREKEYNRAPKEEQDRIRQKLREEREQRRKENPSRPKRRGRRGGRRGIPSSCPDPSMLILMADGSQKKAGDLKVGDLVKTYDEKDLEKAKKLVRNKSLVLSTGGSEKLSEFREQLENSYAKASLGEYKVEFVDIVKDVEKIKLTFEGSEIICSLTHKFYVNNSWKEARNMVAGDKVSGKKLLSIENVEDGDVVHITVENAHTYICEGLLSHNKRRLPPGVRDIRGGGRRPPKGGRRGGRRRSKGTPPRDVPRPGGGRTGGFPSSCPDPSMLILMADGSQKKAGDLTVGDLVKTYHEKDLEKASKKSLVLASGSTEKHSQIRDQLESSYAKATLGEYEVKFVDIVKDVEKIKLTFEGSEIICSLTHKFYVNDSWKEAQDMVIGDEVSDKKLVAIEDVEDGDVVHITIEDAHTYICEGLLSHNKRFRPDDPRRVGVEPDGPKRPDDEFDRGFGGRGRRRRRRVRDRRDRRARLRRRRQALRRARRRRRRRMIRRFGRRFGGRRNRGREFVGRGRRGRFGGRRREFADRRRRRRRGERR